MNRCPLPRPVSVPPHPRWRSLACALGAALALTAWPLQAQVPPGLGNARNFPEAALRGHLVLNSPSDATLNGRALRMAPGMRLFSPQNQLVLAHTVLGQTFQVNYLIEASTGLLQTAWILNPREAEQPRQGSDFVERNFRAASDTTPP
ncbi:MAG: hypothetical protein PHI55_01730 [Burkholderiaceae bacterium]|nr:hypothetical protein [Burkholderiaceae bacterium]